MKVIKKVEVKRAAPPKPTKVIDDFKTTDVDDLYFRKYDHHQCDVPTAKISDAYYLFGTKKIFLKIQNSRLVVRVGGGYMDIDEFFSTYSSSEKTRVSSYLDRENCDTYEELSVYRQAVVGLKRDSIERRNSKSPGRRSSESPPR